MTNFQNFEILFYCDLSLIFFLNSISTSPTHIHTHNQATNQSINQSFDAFTNRQEKKIKHFLINKTFQNIENYKTKLWKLIFFPGTATIMHIHIYPVDGEGRWWVVSVWNGEKKTAEIQMFWPNLKWWQQFKHEYAYIISHQSFIHSFIHSFFSS